MNYIIQVSNEAWMEMSLATLEAYMVPQHQMSKKKQETQLESYGLLWGHGVF